MATGFGCLLLFLHSFKTYNFSYSAYALCLSNLIEINLSLNSYFCELIEFFYDATSSLILSFSILCVSFNSIFLLINSCLFANSSSALAFFAADTVSFLALFSSEADLFRDLLSSVAIYFCDFFSSFSFSN